MSANRSGWTLLLWPLAVLLVAFLGTWPKSSPRDVVDKPGYLRAQIVSIASDQSALRVTRTADPLHTKGWTVPASPPDLRAALKSELTVGDLVEIVPAKAGAGAASPTQAAGAASTAIQAIEIDAEATDVWSRLLAVAGAAALLLLFGFIVLDGDVGSLILGADGRYSKSKFQLVVWFGVAAVCYLSILWLRFCYSSNWLLGSVSIPTNLLTLSGLSALTFGGAKAITQNKVNRVAAAAATAPDPQRAAKLSKAPKEAPPELISDLVHDDSDTHADLGDFQMVFITLLAAVTYLVQFFTYLKVLPMHATVTIPDVDSTMLAIFGLGHGAYLTKKMASGPGATGAAPSGAGGEPKSTAGDRGGANPQASGAPVAQPAPPVPADPDLSRRIGIES